MAKKESPTNPKDLIEATPEEVVQLEKEVSKEEDIVIAKERDDRREKPSVDSWTPKTKLGRLVKSGKEKNIDSILENGKKILEAQIVEALLPLDSDLILIGQAKGKFGGGKRRAWRQTQKKTNEGNVMSFSAMGVVGDRKGHVGVGFGKARETLPAREKALRNAKLGIIKVNLGFESPESEPEGAEPHTIPFKIEGKCGSVRVTFWPAPRGTGLATGDECKKIFALAGVKDIYSTTRGKTKTTFNLAKACLAALEKTTRMKQ